MLVIAEGARDWSERHLSESPCFCVSTVSASPRPLRPRTGLPELRVRNLSEIAAVHGLLGLRVECDVFFEASKSIGAYAADSVLAGSPRIELRTERKSLLQVLDEDAHFRGDPAACRPNGHNWHGSLKGGQ